MELAFRWMTTRQCGRRSRLEIRCLLGTHTSFPLATLGIIEDFWVLYNVREGNGLSHMFQRRCPSYRRLTLEFLRTLKVHKNHRSRIPEMIDFRFGNRNHSFSMENLCEVFHCNNLNPGEEVEYDYFDVWGAMTIEGDDFIPAYAKSSFIRNPVLRFLDSRQRPLQ